MTKPTSIDQAHLAAIVVDYVQRFVNQFNATDLVWVRSMKTSKMGVLNCQCRTVQIASTVRSTFASLIKSATPPTYLGKISISFAHEVGTRVRLSLLRSISRRQKERDPQAICSISAFSARPLLRVGGGKDQGTRFLSFVDAISGFKHLLKQEDLDRALSLCTGLRGHLKSRFLVLSDDRILPPAPQGQQRGKRSRPGDGNDGVFQKRPNISNPPPTSALPTSALPPGTVWGNPIPSGSGVVPNQYVQGPILTHNLPGLAGLQLIQTHPVVQGPGMVQGSVVAPVMQLVPTTSTAQGPGVTQGGTSSQAHPHVPVVGVNGAQGASVVASPGAGFPPLGVVPVSEGFQKVRAQVRSKKTSKGVPTPTRSVPPRAVKVNQPAAEMQDLTDEISEGSEAEYVDASVDNEQV